MQTFYLALDLKNDPELIAEYEQHHREVWPEILEQMKQSRIQKCEIYRVQNRLMMVLETDDHFSFEAKAIADNQNPRVQEWEALMWKYQQALPNSLPGEKWKLMDCIFKY